MYYGLLIKMFLKLVLIDGESYYKLKIINNDSTGIFVQNNLGYHSVYNGKIRPDGLLFVILNPKKEREFSLKCRKKRGYNCWLMRYDTCSSYANIFKRKRRVTGFQFEERANSHMNKNAPVIFLGSKDSLVQNIKTHPNLFLKSSFSNHGRVVDCPPLEEDSLDIYAYLKFKYSFDDKVKARDFSHFYLTSDTIRFKLK